MKRFLLVATALALALTAKSGVLAGGDAPNTLTAKEKADGWKLLFDGKSLDGWRGYKKKEVTGWTVKDGTIVLEKGGSDLLTADEYGDFEFSADFKFLKGNNSGIIYRISLTEGGTTWATGPEMQVMPHKPGEKLGRTAGGSLYDVFAPSTNPFKGSEEWTTMKVVAKGKHIEHYVNGVKVVDCQIGSDEWNKAIATSKWKDSKLFASKAKGHIALQEHGGSVMFRNVKIRELKSGN